MTRAYLRLDPAFDERKAHYPDGPYAALIAAFCLAEHQPQRGRFRSVAYLRALLDKRGRHVPFLLDQGDLLILEDGRVYVVGWDEWQEGDWKVAERVARIRARRGGNDEGNGPGNGPRNGGGNDSPLGGDYSGGISGSGAEAAGILPLSDDPALDAYQRFFTYPSRKALAFLDSLASEFGAANVATAIGEAGRAGTEDLLSRARGILVLREREAAQRERAEEQRRLAEKRSPLRPLMVGSDTENLSPEEVKRRLAEYYASTQGDVA